MSICNECWGKGWIEKQGVQFDCRKCKGTGVIENEPQTNEDWFDTLSTEEKAEVFANASYYSAMMGAEITALPKEDEVRKWKMWLKAPHDWKLWLKEKHNA